MLRYDELHRSWNVNMIKFINFNKEMKLFIHFNITTDNNKFSFFILESFKKSATCYEIAITLLEIDSIYGHLGVYDLWM